MLNTNIGEYQQLTFNIQYRASKSTRHEKVSEEQRRMEADMQASLVGASIGEDMRATSIAKEEKMKTKTT